MIKKKLGIIIPTLSLGGAENAVSRLTSELKEDYDIILIISEDKISYPYNANIEILNVNRSNFILKKYQI